MSNNCNKDRQKEFLSSAASRHRQHSINTVHLAEVKHHNQKTKGFLLFLGGLIVITTLFGVLGLSPLIKNMSDFTIAVSSTVVVTNTIDSSHEELQGSGIVIAPNFVVTSEQVGGKTGILFVKHDGEKYQAYRSDGKSKFGLCLLYVPDLLAPPIVIASKKTLYEGQSVFSIGAIDGKKTTISKGFISELPLAGATPWIVNSAPIHLGSCGGGLFNKEGKLVGITISPVQNSYNTSLAVSADMIRLLPFHKEIIDQS